MASQKVLKPVKYYKPYASGKFKWKDRLTTDFSICKARISLQKNGESPILIDLTVDYKTPSLYSSVPKVMVLMRYLSGPLKKIHLTFGLSLAKPWAQLEPKVATDRGGGERGRDGEGGRKKGCGLSK